MDIEVESQDVIKIMLQFLKENNLHHSMKALQQETNVNLNIVDDVAQLKTDIIHGSYVLHVIYILESLRHSVHYPNIFVLFAS